MRAHCRPPSTARVLHEGVAVAAARGRHHEDTAVRGAARATRLIVLGNLGCRRPGKVLIAIESLVFLRWSVRTVLASRRTRLPIAIGVAGILVGAVLVVGGFGWVPRTSPGTLAFEGVNLNITYSGNATSFYGPTHQNACDQILPPSWFAGSPACPKNMTGGDSYVFEIFSLWGPSDATFTFVNVSLHSPIPLISGICYSPSSVPSLYWNLSQEFPSGDGCGWGVQIALANPAPIIPGGLWLQANMTVHTL